MMKKLSLLLISFALSLFTLQSYAKPDRPEQCPSVNTLKAGGLPYVEIDEYDNTYIAFQIDQYNTKNTWGFGIADLNANSQEEAYDLAQSELSGLTGSPVPVYLANDDIWACFYSTKSGLMAAAVTPFPPSFKSKLSVVAKFK